jgi:hypothetical protein
MKMAAFGSLIYLLIIIGWYVVSEFNSDPSLFLGSLLTFAVGVIFGVLPATVAPLGTGGLLGLIFGGSTSRQSPALGLLAGILLACVVISAVNVVVLKLTEAEPLRPSLYVSLVGLPSLVFVIGFGWIGVWLQKRFATQIAAR